MKVAVFIDHDIICRHFVLSGALAPLVAAADVHFVFPSHSKRVTLDVAALPLGAPATMMNIDGERQRLWSWLLFSDQLRLRPGKQEAAIRRVRWRTLGWKAAAMLTVAGFPIVSSVFKRAIAERLAERPAPDLSRFLDAQRPDVVLHPSVLAGVFINDLVGECAARNIPLVAAMNSWDNPSTKRAVVGTPDRLLVWGPQTKRHATRFMGIDPGQVTEFGAAQFDIFRELPRLTREAFCDAHGIDPTRRILLFAGSNAQTDEAATLEALDGAISGGKLDNVTIVYRPHPWGNGGKDGTRLASATWKNVTVDRTMRAYLDQIAAGNTAISLPDYRDTHDLLSVVDGIVSPLSTILIEGALHEKPVIAYVPADDAAAADAVTMPYLHFEEFFALPDVLIARSLDELLTCIGEIASPAAGAARGARLKVASAQFVTPFDRPWRERIVDLLKSIATVKSRVAV